MNLHKDGNIWLPHKDPMNYLRDCVTVSGVPCYQRHQVNAAVAKCGEKLHTVVDGGAYIGLLALQFSWRFKRVVCFEPIKENFECLQRNTGHVPTIERHHAALANTDGELVLTQSRGQKSFSWTALGESAHTETAHCHRLDTFKFENVNLIKLDVEGYELEALRGAVETIERCKPVVLIEDKHVEGRPACAFLTSLGMTMVWNKSYDWLFVWK